MNWSGLSGSKEWHGNPTERYFPSFRYVFLFLTSWTGGRPFRSPQDKNPVDRRLSLGIPIPDQILPHDNFKAYRSKGKRRNSRWPVRRFDVWVMSLFRATLNKRASGIFRKFRPDLLTVLRAGNDATSGDWNMKLWKVISLNRVADQIGCRLLRYTRYSRYQTELLHSFICGRESWN